MKTKTILLCLLLLAAFPLRAALTNVTLVASPTPAQISNTVSYVFYGTTNAALDPSAWPVLTNSVSTNVVVQIDNAFAYRYGVKGSNEWGVSLSMSEVVESPAFPPKLTGLTASIKNAAAGLVALTWAPYDLKSIAQVGVNSTTNIVDPVMTWPEVGVTTGTNYDITVDPRFARFYAVRGYSPFWGYGPFSEPVSTRSLPTGGFPLDVRPGK